MLTTLVILTSLLAAQTSESGTPPCAPDEAFPAPDVHICRLPLAETDPERLRAALGERDQAVTLDGEVLSAVVSVDAETYQLCCTVQEPMTRVQDGLFAGRWRLRRADEASLYFALVTQAADGSFALRDDLTIVGDARPVLPQREALKGQIERLTVWSEALGEERAVRTYVPPGAHDAPLPVVVFADGSGLEHAAELFEPLIEAGEIVPFVGVGIVSGADAVLGREDAFGYDVRAADYLPGYGEGDPARGGGRQAKHMTFVADELYAPLQAALPVKIEPAGWIAAGRSNGAVFAQHAAMERPDRFSGAIVASRSWARTADDVSAPPARGEAPWFTLTAGLYEPMNLASTRRAARALRQAGYGDVAVASYPGGHDPEQWDIAFHEALLTRLGRREGSLD